MIDFIKKNKNLIISSSIFTGINNNLYCGGCKNTSGKEDKDKKLTTTTPTTTPTSNNNNETPKKDEIPNVDPLKNKKETLKYLLKNVKEENNKLKDECKENITIDDKLIDSKTKDEELNEIETNLNTFKNNIDEKLKDLSKLKEKPNTPGNPKSKQPPVDNEFEKKKTELIEKVNNLEKEFKNYKFDEKKFIKNFKDKLNSLKNEDIDEIEKEFENIDKKLKDIINFDKFLKDNKCGEFLTSSDEELCYDFSFYVLENEKFYKNKTDEIIAKLSNLKITKDNISNYRIVNLHYDNVNYYFVVEFDITKNNILKNYFKDEKEYNDIFKKYINYFILDEKGELKLFTIDNIEFINCIKFTGQKGYDIELDKKKHSFINKIFKNEFEELQPEDEPYTDLYIYKIKAESNANKYHCVLFTTKTLNRIKIDEDNKKFIKSINDNLFYILYNATTKKFVENELKIVSCSSYCTNNWRYVGSYKFTI